jgi:3-oxoacyl-[acyl-carrier protein] reductase
MLSFDFSGRTAVVTGGTRGIGRAITEALLGAGATVHATYAGNHEAAEHLRAELDVPAPRLVLHCFDVSASDQVEAFYQTLDTTADALDILVNCAGIRRDSVVGMMHTEDWQRVLEINLSGTFLMSKLAVHRMMTARFGRIISITSPSGAYGFEGQANYAASKAGQVAFTRSLSKEVAKRGITVNCVSPGFIDTDFIADLPEKMRNQYRSDVPMKRFGDPAEVAAAVLFLASEQAGYVTGATLDVTGGL